MRPNLDRIPGEADRLAEAIIYRAPIVVDQDFVDSLDDAAAAALRRYGARTVTFAYRESSIGLMRRSLLAEGLGLCVQPDDDRPETVAAGRQARHGVGGGGAPHASRREADAAAEQASVDRRYEWQQAMDTARAAWVEGVYVR